jgi:hypothetical protein
MILLRYVAGIITSNGSTSSVGNLILGNTRKCLWERMDKENPNGYPKIVK